MATPDSIRVSHKRPTMDLDLVDFLDRRLSQIDGICACVAAGVDSPNSSPREAFCALWAARDLLDEVREALNGSRIGAHLVNSMAGKVEAAAPVAEVQS